MLGKIGISKSSHRCVLFRRSVLPRRTLIAGGWVITCDEALGDIPIGDILIDAGKIIAIGSKISAGDAEVVDASGMVVIPGLVDTHRHTWQTCVRHTCADIPALEYFDLMMGRRGPRYRPEDVYMGNLCRRPHRPRRRSDHAA